jgi:HEAT repeat protein
MAALTSALAHPDPEVRGQAVVLVSELAEDRARRVLQAMVHDPSPTVRLLAVAVSRTTSLDTIATLIVALGDPDGDVRRAAAAVVARVTSIDPSEREALEQWWTDSRVAELAGATSPMCDTLLEIPSVPWRQST